MKPGIPLAVLLASALVAQDQDQDRRRQRQQAPQDASGPVALDVSISPARLAFVQRPEVTLIDDQEQLDAFQRRARVIPEDNPLRKYSKELEPMKVDFEAVRLVAICWGPHPYEQRARFHLEAATLIRDTVRLQLRTSMVVGTPTPPGRNAPQVVYPACIMAVPRSEHVEVQLRGARMPQGGFRPQRGERLVVTVAPDALPLRDQVEMLPVRQFYNDDDAPPHVRVAPTEAGDRQIVDISWCLFTAETNPIQLDVLELRGDTLHVGVVAHRSRTMIYSGPGTFRPQLRFVAPNSKRVAVHIRRLGEPFTEKDELVDFEPFTRGRLDVTVEHRPRPKPAWRLPSFR